MKVLVKRRLLYCLLVALTVSPAASAQENSALPLEELQVFAEVFGKIKSEYVEEVEDKELIRFAIRGMLSGLDAHSAFLEHDDFEKMQTETDGQFGGLGIEVTKENGLIRIVTPLDGTPAHEAGLEPGDIILKIDGVSVQDMHLDEALTRMRGEPGTEIRLTVHREGVNDLIEVDMVRTVIQIQSVRSELLEPGLGYLRVSSFQSGTAQNMRVQIKELVDDNQGDLDGLVLDLRNNPGGVLSGAVEISDMFLDGGDIVSIKGRIPSSNQTYSAQPGDVLNAMPMVVLVNGGSASASEIVAGALQDHKRAVIIGTNTFGKGSVQSVIPMNYGGALKLTTSLYFTPSDRSIQVTGISPDISSQQAVIAEFLDPDTQFRESDLNQHLENASPEEELPTPGSTLQERFGQDYQLLQAVNLLKGMTIIGSSKIPDQTAEG
ncbi:MAG: S41 family peptidase [Gammaproteobacteria bacterium]|nr:S41 family peptidase [Gammaproteobacteria bacterium]MYJ52724.1 S41 family peptidase [Gammaproteobacteria bacterium]